MGIMQKIRFGCTAKDKSMDVEAKSFRSESWAAKETKTRRVFGLLHAHSVSIGEGAGKQRPVTGVTYLTTFKSRNSKSNSASFDSAKRGANLVRTSGATLLEIFSSKINSSQAPSTDIVQRCIRESTRVHTSVPEPSAEEVCAPFAELRATALV